MRQRVHSTLWRGWAVSAVLGSASISWGQVAITEVMHNPGGVDALWEWIEIRNTSGAPLDLDGWVFDDDDDSSFGEANITAANGNTIVPTGGVAVLYAGDELDFMSQRFLNAWGGNITLIPVDGFTALTGTDAIGLWPSHNDYEDDALAGTMSPRRTFSRAAASLNYSIDFPTAGSGSSIAWNGTGSRADGANWVESEEGALSAFASIETTIASAQINSTLDLGNPGVLPAGAASPGLRVSEIMFAPQSPQVTVGFSEADFEWVEILNNTNAAIDFSATPYVFDDMAGNKLSAENIESGTLAIGGAGILFNSARITLTDMETMWGAELNYIPVTSWPSLNNTGGDTIAIWDSIEDYDSEAETDGPNRTHANAIMALTYDTVAGDGWPTNNDRSSFYLNNLTDDPNVAESWARSADGDSLGSHAPVAIFQSAVDHPGGDIGSPGFAPPIVATGVPGDYNQSGTVDAADYVMWRNSVGTAISLPNDTTPGSVTQADYGVWRTNFGRTAGAGSGLNRASVPEPAGVAIALFGCASLAITQLQWTRARR